MPDAGSAPPAAGGTARDELSGSRDTAHRFGQRSSATSRRARYCGPVRQSLLREQGLGLSLEHLRQVRGPGRRCAGVHSANRTRQAAAGRRLVLGNLPDGSGTRRLEKQDTARKGAPCREPGECRSVRAKRGLRADERRERGERCSGHVWMTVQASCIVQERSVTG